MPENAIIINGVLYAFEEVESANEIDCALCSLHDMCDPTVKDSLCTTVFGWDVMGKAFKEGVSILNY